MMMFWESVQRLKTYGFDPDRQVRDMFMVFNIFLGLGVACFVTFLSAVSINLERERESWDLLITTPLNYGTVLFGKLISSVLFVWLLLVALMPFYGIFFLVGGVSFNEVVFSFLIMTEVTVVIALIGIFCSICWKRTIQSVSYTFIFEFFYIIGITGISIGNYIISSINGNQPSVGIEFLLSPLMITIIYLFDFPVYRSVPIYLNVSSWVQDNIILTHFIIVGIMILLLILLCMYMLSHPKEKKERKIFSDKRLNLNSTVIQNFFDRFKPDLRYPDGKNPIYVKDFRAQCNKRWLWISTLGLCLFGFFILYFIFSLSTPSWGEENVLIMLGFVMFTPILIIPFAANCIRNELDRDTFDLLATTEMTNENFVRGKLKAGFRFFIIRYLFISSSLIITSILISVNYVSPVKIQTANISAIVLSILSAYLILSFGLFISTVVKSSISAYALTFVSGIVLYFGSFLSVALLDAIFRLQSNYAFYSFASIFSPFLMYIFSATDDIPYFSWELQFSIQISWMYIASIYLQKKTISNLNQKKYLI